MSQKYVLLHRFRMMMVPRRQHLNSNGEESSCSEEDYYCEDAVSQTEDDIPLICWYGSASDSSHRSSPSQEDLQCCWHHHHLWKSLICWAVHDHKEHWLAINSSNGQDPTAIFDRGVPSHFHLSNPRVSLRRLWSTVQTYYLHCFDLLVKRQMHWPHIITAGQDSPSTLTLFDISAQ